MERSGKFSLQLDEATDISNNAQLKVLVQYLDYVEQFLFCRPLTKNITGKEIFKKVDSFLKKHQLKWSGCVPVQGRIQKKIKRGPNFATFNVTSFTYNGIFT